MSFHAVDLTPARELVAKEKEYLRAARRKLSNVTDPAVDKAKLVHDEDATVRLGLMHAARQT